MNGYYKENPVAYLVMLGIVLNFFPNASLKKRSIGQKI